MRRESTQALLCALAAMSLTAGPAVAATSTWTGGGDGTSWTDAANWDTAPANDGTTDVAFNGAAPAGGTTISLGGSQDINSIKFNNDNGFTLGSASDTLTVESGNIISSARSTIGAGVLLGADGTTGTQSYHHSLQIDGPIGEVGGSRSLTLNTSGGRSTYINGDNTYTGATIVNSGRENVFTGSTQTSSITVQGPSASSLAGFGIVSADSLGSGPLSLTNTDFRMGGQDITINNPTTMGGRFVTNAISSYGTNFIPSFPGTPGHGVVTFANPVTLTSDVTIAPSGYYQKGPHFAGGFTGNHSLTWAGEYGMVISGASTYTGGTVVTHGGGDKGGLYRLEVSADGGLGTGDVTVETDTLQDAALLTLDTDAAIDPAATLTLTNGWELDLNFTGTQEVSGLVINGDAQAPGTTIDSSYTDPGSSYHPISGDGAITVVAVPEPASLALLGLGGGLMMLRRRRRGAPEAGA